jgi:hypothetical protein
MGEQPDFQLHRGRGELSLQQYPAQVWGQFEVGGSDDGFGIGVDSDALRHTLVCATFARYTTFIKPPTILPGIEYF